MISLVAYTSEPLNAMALATLLESHPDVRPLAIVSDLSRFRERVAAGKPDVILLSVDGAVDWSFLHIIRSESPNSRLVLWLHDISAESAYQAMESGVRGILRKSLPPDMILKCVRKVFEGEMWFDKSLTQTFLNGRTVKVSRRETQLITLISQGLKNKEIASVMDISEGTVKVYLSRLYEKVGVRDRYELALFGLRATANPAEPLAESQVVKTVFVAATSSAEPTRRGAKTQPARLFSARVVH